MSEVQEVIRIIEASVSPAVMAWLNWMAIVFFASLIFIKQKPAQWILLATISVNVIGFGIWLVTRNIHLMGISHFFIWIPLIVYLYQKVINNPEEKLKTGYWNKSYYIWVCIAVLTMIISMIFDVRDVYLVMTGQR